MDNILFLDNHEITRRLYSANIEVYTGANVIELDSIEDAITYLDEYEPKLIITRSKIEQRNAGEKISILLKGRTNSIPLIIIGDSNISIYEATIFKEPFELNDLVLSCAKILGVTAKGMAKANIADYYPISIHLLLPGFQLISSLYKINMLTL